MAAYIDLANRYSGVEHLIDFAMEVAIMKRREALAVLGAAGATRLAAAPSAREQIIGVWKCVRQYNIGEDGKEVPVSVKQRGHISWDRSGRVWVLLYNEGRKPPAKTFQPTLDEFRGMFAGLMTYYGRYTIDEEKKTVTHHIEAAAWPNLMGTDLVRQYHFDGNRLTLKFAGKAQHHIVFERLPNA